MLPGEPLAVRVRCTNTSLKPWRFRPGKFAGIHVMWWLLDSDDQQRGEGRAGLFQATIAPGESIELTLALTPLYKAGKYRLRVDLNDEQNGHFFQFGGEMLEVEVVVP
jgi:hypothetical protein